jgi:ABC-type branched-subunit amino acid transport system ATPase component
MTSSVIACADLQVGYGSLPVLFDLDIEVRRGEVVSLLGPNGAGKTTLLRALSGALPAQSGEVFWQGKATRASLHRRCRDGLGVVPEERSVTMGLTVAQNLRIGGCDPTTALARFPELAPHVDRQVGLLSGGQQQILALARALARRPVGLLADELSLGLAPKVVTRLLSAVRHAAEEDGLAVLLVEQHVRQALTVADRVYVMHHGRIDWSGTAAEALESQARIEESYLSGGERGGALDLAGLERT